LFLMNILFCKNNFAGPISGADEIVLTYAIELRAAGHTTSVLLVQPPSSNDPLAARLRAADVPLDTLASTAFSTSLATARRVAIRAMRTFSPVSGLILSNSRKVVFNLLQQYHVACCEYLQRKRPDVVHVLTPDPGAVMLVRAAHEVKIPVVYQEVGIPFHPPGFEDVYERFVSVMPLCAEVTALSPALARALHGVSTRTSPAKVLPLISPDHNGFPKSQSSNEVVTFGFAARLEHLKGPMRLLEAFSVAHQTHSAMKLCVAGEGSQRREFIAGSRRLGLDEKCELVGVYKSIEERSEFMKKIEVFVLPSLTEGTPNVIIEAMAHEKPIIATAVGGVPDLVPDDVGILVPPDDNLALAAAMTRMAADSELRRSMGAAARRKYEQLFTPAVVLPVLLDLYAGIIERNGTNKHVDTTRPRPSHPWV
jgi:glycosyltransferase involved in cell wall biosynthesis